MSETKKHKFLAEDPKALRDDILEDIHEKWYKRKLSAPTYDIDNKKLPIGMKIFAVLCVLGAIIGLVELIEAIVQTVKMFEVGQMNDLGVTTIVVSFVRLADLLAIDIVFLIFGIRLFLNQRHYAAFLIYVVYALLILGAICSLTLYGVDLRLLAYGILIGILIAFQIYLDPNLRKERIDYFAKRNELLKEEKESGTLGLDPSGKGYIDLNFFNLFWIFVVASIVGDAVESVFHVLIVDPGHWQDRAGLLFGPFSPIYGCGAVLMTLFLNRLYKRNVIIIFLLSAVIGGAFEYFVSVFMQYTFGAVAWNYTGQFLSIGGRTCGLAMAAWGLLGVIWLKLILPLLLKLINLIPWNWRYGVTAVAAALMLVDCVMSLEALDCWYERLANRPIDTPVQEFYNDYFNNNWMENRFQSMTIDPSSAVRK